MTLRRLIPVMVWGSIVIAGIIVLGPPLWTYVRGTPATARVDACHTSYEVDQNGNGHDETTCTGAWTAGGARHSGEIDGALPAQVHRTIAVRAVGDRASTFNTITTSLWVTGFMVALGALGHFAALRSYDSRGGRRGHPAARR